AGGNPFITTVGSGAGATGGEIGLVNLSYVSNIVFSGITFEGAAGSLFFITSGQNNLISNCTLNGCSCDGVDMVNNTVTTAVSYCTIANMGEIGVFMLDGNLNRVTLTADTNAVIDNTIYNMSRLCWTYNPGISIHGVGQYAAHNLIYNGRHNAILVYGNNNVVEYNEIHNVCTETSDAGAIYMGRDWTQRGNIIRYNYLHNINRGGGAISPNGVVGVYLDDLFCGATIYGNIFSAVDHGVQIGGGRDNIVQDNIFVGCTNVAIEADQRGLGWEASMITSTNSIMWTELYAMPYQTPPWSVEYPALVPLPTNNPGAAVGNIIQNNISYSNALWISWQDNAQTNVMVTNNFTSGDPLFVNSLQPQLGLLTNSPVWGFGFQPIPSNIIGARPLPPTDFRVVGSP
ncbi:MAG TPA: right-handed parallel beta-helix repeat-containing protein, partial [Candidatus Baltobacteraceae bacterium]|nr:right-handed parallel beta-helix repeat-containing protein [Candidatus Baltobacteraceae bacterium]